MNVVIPAPEIPPKINKGGSQHQLEAMNAESNAPKLAKRPPVPPPSVAPGDLGCFDAQQSGAGASFGVGSSFIANPPPMVHSFASSRISAVKSRSAIVSFNFSMPIFCGSNVTNNRSRSSVESGKRFHSSSTDTTPSSPSRACLTLFGQSSHKMFSRAFIPAT